MSRNGWVCSHSVGAVLLVGTFRPVAGISVGRFGRRAARGAPPPTGGSRARAGTSTEEGWRDHETADMRGAADAAFAPRTLAVPPLALPPRPALAGAGAPAQALVRVRAGALGGGPAGLSPPAARRVGTGGRAGGSWRRRRGGAASRIEPCPQPRRRCSGSRSTRSAAWRWTPSRRPTRGTRARRWRSRRWPTRCSSASCARTRATRGGPTATASCSAPGTRACCSTRCCISPAMS